MKNSRRLLISSLLLLIFISISCQKEDSDENSNDNLLYSEQAYPGINGDTLTIFLDGHPIVCEYINGEYIYQGDIIIVPDDELKSTKGSAINASLLRWHNGIVPYTIHKDFPNQNRITKAINEYEVKTNIVFIPRTNEFNYVEFFATKDNSSSFLGVLGGRQRIRIAEWGTTGTVIHEIGHALGLLHEHCRNDRDNYVQIHWDNIPLLDRHNFIKWRTPFSINTQDFDFNSIMMYGPFAFSDNQEPTITKINGSGYSVNRDYLSDGDIEIINQIYSNAINSDFNITAEIHEYNSDWDNIVQNEFGSDFRLADWSDLVSYYNAGGDLLALFDELGLTEYGNSAFLYRNGQQFYTGARAYFATRHEHNKPSSYLAHENINNYLISLGSWDGSRKIMVIKK